jgi:hypothetical protein
MGEQIWNFVRNNLVQWLALCLSVANLILYLRTMRKEQVKLKIKQIEPENTAYYFPYVWFEKISCMFFKISIDNISKSETSISNITAIDSCGNEFSPKMFERHLPLSKGDKLLIHQVGDKDRAYSYELASENLLNNLRVLSYGNISGFLYFENVGTLSKDSEPLTLIIDTPSKQFEQEIVIKKLPSNMFPVDGNPSHQRFD